MVTYLLKILQQILQDFQSVYGHFGALCIKELRTTLSKILWPLLTDRGHLSQNFEVTKEAA